MRADAALAVHKQTRARRQLEADDVALIQRRCTAGEAPEVEPSASALRVPFCVSQRSTAVAVPADGGASASSAPEARPRSPRP